MSARELFRRFPAAAAIPHLPLADLPTPVRRLEGAGRELGLDLWVKHDDQSGRAYGGNKVRKLEFLLADARAQNFDTVWTVGGIGSHHCLATCIWAEELGIPHGVLQFPQPITAHVQRNIRALASTAPAVHLLANSGDALGPAEFSSRLRAWRSAHPDIYYIPGGGSSPVGALGYVNAALELCAQVDAGALPPPDAIVVAAGTCGTIAGLIVGLQLGGLEARVHGVRVVDDFIANDEAIARLAQGAAEILRGQGVDVPDFDATRYRLDARFFGPGYGVPTPQGLGAMELLHPDGLVLEPTYTAKAFAAIVADAPELAARGERVLYWHTLSGADIGARVARGDLGLLPEEYTQWATEAPEYP